MLTIRVAVPVEVAGLTSKERGCRAKTFRRSRSIPPLYNPAESIAEEDAGVAVEVIGHSVELVANERNLRGPRKKEEGLSDLKITAGPYEFVARWEREKSPETCEAFERLLPYRQRIIHVRWSGESCWIPLGNFDLGVGFEDATSYPAPGEILLYPGGYSETEILLPYGGTQFASKLGQLAGNHFLTVTGGQENLRPLGEMTLWEGAQDIAFEKV